MKAIVPNKITITIFMVSLLLLAWTKIADNYSENYTSDALKNAAITYGIARGVNGVISLAQGTTLGVSLVGNVNFAIGEILDPINDLVERFSWIVMMAMASLGIQKLLIGISSSILFNILLLISVSFYLFSLWRNLEYSTRNFALKSVFIVFFIRFALISVLFANHAVNTYYLDETVQQATQELEQAKETLKSINIQEPDVIEQKPQTEDAETGVMTSMQNAWSSMKQAVNGKRKIEKIEETAESMVSNILNLIVAFILQTIIIPVLFLWGFYKGLRALLTIKIAMPELSSGGVLSS